MFLRVLNHDPKYIPSAKEEGPISQSVPDTEGFYFYFLCKLVG